MAEEFLARRGLQAGMDLAGAERDPANLAAALPPLDQWNPPFCGDIDMRIARDGTWYYCGTPIGRPALVRLFSAILRKDPDGYVLVTPAEKVGIKVEDAPFLAVDMTVAKPRPEQILRFSTNAGDRIEAGCQHPIRFEKTASGGMKPYILVRGDLWALATRAVFLDLAGLGEIREHEGAPYFGVTSAGVFFAMAKAGEVEEFEAGEPKGSS